MRNAIGYADPEVISMAFEEYKIPKDARILDIACGSGLIVRTLAKKGYKTFDGIDASQKMLEKAREFNLY